MENNKAIHNIAKRYKLMRDPIEKRLKDMLIHVSPGKPISYADQGNGESKSNDPIPEHHLKIINAVSETIKAYSKAASELLTTKYSNIQKIAPKHLVNPCNIYCVSCNDGIIVRYEISRTDETPTTLVGYTEHSFVELAPTLSENVVFCYYDAKDVPSIQEDAPNITCTTVNPVTNEESHLAVIKVAYNLVLKRPENNLPKPPQKPYCLFSIRNSTEVLLHIKHKPISPTIVNLEESIIRTQLELPVGWACIEIYPSIDPSNWQPEYASIWAENDILAAVVTNKLREDQFTSIDPNANSRAKFLSMLKEFKDLLESNPEREEVLQQYLKENPLLLCPTQTEMWSKLAIGSNVTDFVFKEATGDYVLVELEKSTDPLFTKKGDRSHQLNHALDQIANWKRYISDNLLTVRNELKLNSISSNPRSLLVIGRSKSISVENKKLLQILENDNPKNKIITYDDLYNNTKAIVENMFGPLWITGGNTQIYHIIK